MRLISRERKTLRTDAEKRKDKAIALFQKGYVAILDRQGTMFKVWSETEKADSKGRHPSYSVLLDEISSCTCPDNAFRGSECKHILAARMARHELGYPIE